MLSQEIVRKIEQLVYSKPRSVQEISEHIDKNWRTADRYINEIEKEYGTIATRVFRGGTRGALKIVYWASIEKATGSVFQEQMEETIMSGRTKFDFSPFDLFQHIKDKNKEAIVEYNSKEDAIKINELNNFLLQAKKQLLIFSGNLSFINFEHNGNKVIDALKALTKKGVSIKVLSRVDFAGRQNIDKLLSLNFGEAKESVEIRHREQPLRAILLDNRLFKMKEIKESTGRTNELGKKAFIFYTIKDKEWGEWLSRIFWKMFSSSIGANKRLVEMNKLRQSNSKSL